MPLEWSDRLDDVDWAELSALYRAAPLGNKHPDWLREAFTNSRLRCFVREGLLEFIRREWPGTLPHARAELALVGGAGRNRTARRSPDAHHG